VNLRLFDGVWHTSEQDLPVICSIAEQQLSFEIHTHMQQRDYGARTTEPIILSWK